MTGQAHLLRAPETDDELWMCVRYFWGVKIPRVQVCADHVAPFTAFRDAYFAQDTVSEPGVTKPNSLALWHGSRGLSGKSFALSILGLAMATFLGSDVNLLGGSFTQSKNIAEHMNRARYYHRAPGYSIARWGAKEIELTNGAIIKPLTASQRTVRGPHPPRLLLDEIDEMEQAILDAALGQPMEQVSYLGEMVLPYTVMCSTWQNPDGTFTEMMRRAEEDGFPTYPWCYRESQVKDVPGTPALPEEMDGWLSERQILEKKRSTPREMWRVEYELGEPSIGNRAMDSDCVEFCFDQEMNPVFEKKETDFEEYTFEKPDGKGTYVGAADWGKASDYTVIGVIRTDGPRRKLVKYLRVNRRPYPIMVGYFNRILEEYGIRSGKAIHDSTGLGTVVDDYVDTRAWGFSMTGEKRAAMLTEYVSAIEAGAYSLPKIRSMYSEHKYCRTGDLYSSASTYHLPDSVAMMALAHRAAGAAVAPTKPQTVSRSVTDPMTWLGEELGEDPSGRRREGDVVRQGEDDVTELSLTV